MGNISQLGEAQIFLRLSKLKLTRILSCVIVIAKADTLAANYEKI